MEVVQELSDRIRILQGGRLLADAPTPELMGYFKEQRFLITLKSPAVPAPASWALPSFETEQL